MTSLQSTSKSSHSIGVGNACHMHVISVSRTKPQVISSSYSLDASPPMLTLLTLMAVFPYLLGVGLVLLLHSFRSRATSWVTPTHVMSSLICWCHVFLGRPRRLVPGIASYITLRVTLSASRLWTCPNQRRRPPRITSSIGEMCSMRRISSFRT